MTPEELLNAYTQGFFPWPEDEHEPVNWYNPDPRFVLLFKNFHIAHSLQKSIRQNPYTIRSDTCFREVMHQCRQTPRPNQPGTWITQELVDAYTQLHELGFAHSIEAYLDNQLVGGLYGISLGGVFFGESMFSHAPNASKIAFVALVQQLIQWNFDFIDCQAYTDHLARFGATFWPRAFFLEKLQHALTKPTRQGIWRL